MKAIPQPLMATSGQAGGAPAAAGGASSRPKSKAYMSTVAIQSDAAKYRQKYKELKRKVHGIEQENDKIHVSTLRIKRNIERLRLERAILYDRLEAEMSHDGAMVQGDKVHADRSESAQDASMGDEDEQRAGDRSEMNTTATSISSLLD